MTTVQLNTVTRRLEVFSSARDIQARAEIAEHKAAADPHPQYLGPSNVAAIATSGDAADLIAGTVPDGRMPGWTGYTAPTRAALEAAVVPAGVDALSLLGYTAIGDGGGTRYKRAASEPVHEHKIQSADGAWWEEIFAVDVTVNIPSDFATLQEAIDRLSKQPVRQGVRIILNIESGHQPTVGFRVDDGDYSHFRITSTDPVVTVAPSFTGSLIRGFNCRMPVLAALFDMNQLGSDGYVCSHGSTGTIEPGAGVKNAGEYGAEIRSSVVHAAETIWTGAGYSAIRLENGAIATFQGADASGSSRLDDPNSSMWGRSVFVSRGSILNFADGVCANAGGDGIGLQRSWLCAPGVQITNSGIKGIRCDQGSHAAIQSATITGSAGEDLLVGDGSTIAAHLATYGTTNQPENIVTGAGIIYNDGLADISYHTENILGTVSQSAGVPTGAVIEQGSNANGAYTKFADGTLICTHALLLTFYDAVRLRNTWTFPQPFVGADAYSWSGSLQQRNPSNVVDNQNLAGALKGSVIENAHSATLIGVDVYNPDGPFVTGDRVWVSLTATGRWF